MTKRQKILIVIIIILLLILITAIAIYVYTSYRSQQQPAAEKQEAQPAAEEIAVQKPEGFYIDGATVAEVVPQPQAPAATDQSSIKAIALSFVERFGSFSNQADFENIEDLKIFMSEKMKEWADTYITEKRAKKTEISEYYGITTRVLSTDIKEIDEEKGTAKLLLNTQRVEYKGVQRQSNIFYQEIDISMIKENNVWVVDSANWK